MIYQSHEKGCVWKPGFSNLVTYVLAIIQPFLLHLEDGMHIIL